MKEVDLGRVAGPFKEVPFSEYIQSPIGLVPKAGSDQTRLIFHLSYEFKGKGMHSVNFHIPKEKCSVKYQDLDFTVNAYLKLCDEIISETAEDEQRAHGCATDQNYLKRSWKTKFNNHARKKPMLTILAGKSDLKSAFRILGLSSKSWQWLVM